MHRGGKEALEKAVLENRKELNGPGPREEKNAEAKKIDEKL